jgi:hypothetical protein
MDDVTQLVDAIREQVLARMRELREGTSGPRWTGTVAAARDELLRAPGRSNPLKPRRR